MDQFLIRHSEAVEIFCRMICKFEKREISHLKTMHETREITSLLQHYDKKDNAKPLIEDFYATTKDVGKNAYKATLKDFIHNVRRAIPVYLSETAIKRFYTYLGLTDEHKRVPVKAWDPDEKIKEFTDSTWSIYHFDEQYCITTQTNESGVVKGTLQLKMFGRAEIRSLAQKSGSEETYYGRFIIMNKSFLHLDMRLTDGQKELQLLFYIGASKPKLAIGEFNNASLEIYSGTTLIEAHKPIPSNSLKPAKFYVQKEEEKLDRPHVPDYVWSFFANKATSLLTIPLNVTTAESLRALVR